MDRRTVLILWLFNALCGTLFMVAGGEKEINYVKDSKIFRGISNAIQKTIEFDPIPKSASEFALLVNEKTLKIKINKSDGSIFYLFDLNNSDHMGVREHPNKNVRFCLISERYGEDYHLKYSRYLPFVKELSSIQALFKKYPDDPYLPDHLNKHRKQAIIWLHGEEINK